MSVLVPTSIQLTDMKVKWGLVTVYADGGIDRQYRITADEAAAVLLGLGASPPGCTRKEWHEGRVAVSGRPCFPGQAVRNPDGTLVVNCGVREDRKRVHIDLIQLAPHQWAIDAAGRVSIASQYANQMDTRN